MRLVSVISIAASLASAARLSILIPTSNILPNPSTLAASTHAVLIGPSGMRHEAPLRRDLSFTFDDLKSESYLLTIYAHDYFFPPLRVDISDSEGKTHQEVRAWQTFRGNEWDNKGPSFGAAQDQLTIQVRPAGQKDFYQARNGFNILNFFKSPMILMGLFSVVVLFGMPYLMDNMDEETKAEFEEMQKNNAITGTQGAANSIQNFDLAGFLSGKSSS